MRKSIGEHVQNYLKKHSGDDVKVHEFADFIQGFFEEMDSEYSEVKTAFYSELEDFAEEMDEETIVELVENLKHRDGSISGTKWTKEETKSVAKQYDVESKLNSYGKKYDCLKFWLAMNYVYAVHYSVNRTINGYVDLAVDEYTNKNICFDYLMKKVFEKM